jgi:hypothetical protein
MMLWCVYGTTFDKTYLPSKKKCGFWKTETNKRIIKKRSGLSPVNKVMPKGHIWKLSDIAIVQEHQKYHQELHRSFNHSIVKCSCYTLFYIIDNGSVHNIIDKGDGVIIDYRKDYPWLTDISVASNHLDNIAKLLSYKGRSSKRWRIMTDPNKEYDRAEVKNTVLMTFYGTIIGRGDHVFDVQKKRAIFSIGDLRQNKPYFALSMYHLFTNYLHRVPTIRQYELYSEYERSRMPTKNRWLGEHVKQFGLKNCIFNWYTVMVTARNNDEAKMYHRIGYEYRRDQRKQAAKKLGITEGEYNKRQREKDRVLDTHYRIF